MNKENKILRPDCGFEGDIAGFIYAELDAAAAERVTLHLASCKGCSEDVEGLTGAMLAFRNWRSSEFDGLSTPPIELPGAGRRAGATTYFAAWLRFLLRPQVVVAVSFFVLIAVVAGIYFNSSGHVVDTASVPAVGSGSLDPKPAHSTDIAPSPALGAVNGAATTPAMAESSERGSRAQVPRVTRISASRAAATIRHSRSVTGPAGNQYARKAVTVPEVVEKRETEDETLRLADLFSEVDAG